MTAVTKDLHAMFNVPEHNIRRSAVVLLFTALSLSSTVAPALAIGAGDAVFNGINVPSLTPSQCVATDAANNLISTGFACGTGSGVTAVTGSGNVLSSGGTTPNITTVAAPTFAGNVTGGSFTSAGAGNFGSVNATGAVSGATVLATGLTVGDCIQAAAGGLLTSTPSACGTVTSVNAGTNTTITGTAEAPIVNVSAAPTFAGTITAANVINNGLTALNCAGTDAVKQMNSSGELCPTTYISGVRGGGLHVETSQKVVPSVTPWQSTFTFGHSYTAAPFCTTTILNATPLYSGATIVSESTTNVVIYDSSNQGYTYNIICVGF